MKLTKYPDGTSYICETKLGQQVFRVNTYEDLWHLNQFVDAFHSEYNTGQITKMRPNIIIPNLIDAQADRRFNEGESSGLKLVLKFLAGLQANFWVFHPHNAEVVEALADNITIISNEEFIKEVLTDLYLDFRKEGKKMGNLEDHLILFSSDAGGYKPLMKLCDKLTWEGETYGASKSRKYVEGKSKITQLVDRQDFEGKDILIIDDISIGGGTFKGLSKLLRERNCGKLYLAVSHMTTQNLGNDPVTNYFDKVFTTNSKYDEYLAEGTGHDKMGYSPSNLEIIKLF